MALLEWSDDYSVGVEAIDEEHRELIDLINRLGESMEEPRPRHQLIGYLRQILTAVRAHFEHEEQEMLAARYEEYDAHKEDHDRLVQDLHGIIDEISERNVFEDVILRRTLGDWCEIHFRTFDARLHRRLGC